MMDRSHALLLVALLSTASATSVAAQSGSGQGFLFREPTLLLTIHGGFAQPAASSDLFTFTTDELTLGKRDFAGANIGADLAIRLSPRMDLVLGTARSSSNRRSEFRDFVDSNDQPIEQTTSFYRVPLSATLRYHLTPRGRSVGSLAWIPATLVPWVGVGGGTMKYRFQQHGDFINYQTMEVFNDRFEAKGWAPMLQGSAGANWSLSPTWQLTGELRYVRAKGELGDDFVGFDRLDLSGLSTSLGISLRF